jgi:hypothetical protein
MEVFRNDNDSGNGQDIEINDRYVSDQIDEDEQYHHRGYKKITTNINGRYHT